MSEIEVGTVHEEGRGKSYLSIRGVANKSDMHAALRLLFSRAYLVLWQGHSIGGGHAVVVVGFSLYRFEYDDAYGTAELYGSRAKLRKIAERQADIAG
tara:strand:+ start:14660 stop:14953 length:294 start_codon:yes stop_codon:yes gene_type:complete